MRSASNRLAHVDNLRWSMILLVLGVHAAIPYSHIGPWYVYDPRPPSPTETHLFLAFEATAQAFFMGLLFFLAGLFAPVACDRRGIAGFVRERLVRLGIPTLGFMLVIQPLIICYLMRVWPQGFWHGFLTLYLPSRYFPSGSGPMWFALALLIFSLIYALARRLGVSARPPLPASLPGLVAFGLLIAVLAFLVRWVQPIGTSVLNMQLCYFVQYVVLFWAGIAAARQGALDRVPEWRPWMGWALALGTPASWLALSAVAGVGRGDWSYLGNGTWQSAVHAVWESLLCVLVCVALLSLYRKHVDRVTPAARFLSDNAFGVYVFHTPILVALTVLMNGEDWSPGTKFVLTFVATAILTFAFVHLVARRTPGLRRVM